MRIISSPNNFIRVQYLIILCFQEDPTFFQEYQITSSFGVYGVHSTYVPKIRVLAGNHINAHGWQAPCTSKTIRGNLTKG
jgi:hypothetical protein